MTKLRPPVSVENTLFKVIGLLGLDQAAGIAEHKAATLRKWSDHGKSNEITYKAAVRLDAACLALAGVAPFHETYQRLLEEAAEAVCADCIRLAAETATAAKEAGEAISALVLASSPGAPEALKIIAKRQAEEAVEAFLKILPLLGLSSGLFAPRDPDRGPEVPPPPDMS